MLLSNLFRRSKTLERFREITTVDFAEKMEDASALISASLIIGWDARRVGKPSGVTRESAIRPRCIAYPRRLFASNPRTMARRETGVIADR
jgi:hypothetical protein